ncbi:MAG: DUF6064 family protein [Flavonifractor plautii]
MQALLLLLWLLYPLVSLLLGNAFPQMVTHIMPCPIVSLSITVCAGYRYKNRLLLALLTLWGLTGIKSIFFTPMRTQFSCSAACMGLYSLSWP